MKIIHTYDETKLNHFNSEVENPLTFVLNYGKK